ncbi:MAG: hypothetical protein Q8P56_04425 [Candidatus Uhrbacteria bacterium]|nr:hypothetical protein [Candidatus Uhrbacteria bacterium]
MEHEFLLAGDLPTEEALAGALFGDRKQLFLAYNRGGAVKTVGLQVNGARRYDTHGRVQIEIRGETADRLPFRASLDYANPERSGIVFDPKP